MSIKSTSTTGPRALTLAVSLALASGQAAAATFTVTHSDDSGPGSLRDAVAQANDNPGADQIDFSTALSTITLTSGQIEIDEDLEIVGPAGGQTISGDNASRILVTTDASVDLTLENLALIDGFNDGIGNSIYCDGDRGRGGAICAEGSLTLRNCTISRNVTIGSDARGGGISVNGPLTLQSSVVSGNTTLALSSLGGGVHATDNVTLTDSIIAGNETQGDAARGGGLFVSPVLTSATPTVTLRRSAVVSNTTGGQDADGGGLALIDVELTLENSTVSSNATTGGTAAGGGIWGDDVDADFYNTTITANSSGYGAGGLHLEDRPIGTYAATLDSTILASNTGADGNVQVTGNTLNSEFSLFGDAGSEITGTDSNNILTDVPELSALDDRGCAAEAGAPGMSRCVPGQLPLAASPALEAGRNSLSLSNDQRGSGFARTIGAGTDIGALESGVELDVTPDPLAFSPRPVGDTSPPRTVTIRNIGSADLSLSTLALSGSDVADFSLGNDGCSGQTLGTQSGVDDTCQFEVTFTPGDEGVSQASAVIPSNATTSPNSVALSGASAGVFSDRFEDN